MAHQSAHAHAVDRVNMKSFEIIFDTEGNATIFNVQGADGLDCLDVTKEYIEEMEDKAEPAVTIIDDHVTLTTDNTLYEDGA